MKPLKVLFPALLLCLFAFAQEVPVMPGAVPLPTSKVQLLDTGGRPCGGCKLWTYAAGTSTLQTTWTDSWAGTPNTNPVVLDSSGRGDIWINSQSYKLVLEKAPFTGGGGHGSTVWTTDNVSDTAFYYIDHLRFVSDSQLLSYSLPGGPTGFISRSVREGIGDSWSVKGFDTVQHAISASTSKKLRFPYGTYTCSGLNWGGTSNMEIIIEHGADLSGCALPAVDATHWIVDERDNTQFSVAAGGLFTNTKSHAGILGTIAGADMSLFSSNGATSYVQAGVAGYVTVPHGSTVFQADGADGVVDCHADGPQGTGTVCMGGFFQTHMFGSNNTTWGMNSVGVLMTGADHASVQNEVDFDIQAGVTHGRLIGWSIQSPYLDSVPDFAAGVYVGKPGCTTPDRTAHPLTGCPQLSSAFATNDGAAVVALSLGPNGYNPGTAFGSQFIQLTGITADNVRHTAGINTDASGSLFVAPASGGALNFTSTTSWLPTVFAANHDSQRASFESVNGSNVTLTSQMYLDQTGQTWILPAVAGSIVLAGQTTISTGDFNVSSGNYKKAGVTGSIVFPFAVVTSTATAETFVVNGVTSSSHCSLAARNAAAATNIATTFINSVAAGGFSMSHAAVANMNYDVLCSAN